MFAGIPNTEKVDLILSGSSAKMLSREVATSMRGRALEVLVHPFSFREVLRHKGVEPTKPYSSLAKAQRSALEKHLRSYLTEGGFPEAQGLSSATRSSLLRSYVDVAILRDVIERHAVSNPVVLRWMVRHLLGNPAASFSVNKFFEAAKSQDFMSPRTPFMIILPILEDAFLIRTISMHTASERQRMANPRKSYPVVRLLIPVYERTGRSNLGHALESAIFIELERRGAEIGYVRTGEGHEVDFLARDTDGAQTLIRSAPICLMRRPAIGR